MAAGAAMMPYGVHYGSGDDLYKIFIKPFVDVVQTAAGKTKEVSRRAQTLVRVAFEAVATTVVPVLRDDYAEIFAREKQEIENIRQQYGDVYRSNWDAFLDNDALVVAFFYSPTAFLTAAFVRKAPKMAAQVISVLSGGQLDGYLSKVGKKLGWNSKIITGLGVGDSSHVRRGGTYGGGLGGTYDSAIPMESVIHEDEEKRSNDIAQYLANEKVRAKLNDSSIVKNMRKDGRKIVQGTLASVFKQAQGVMSANSLDDLQKKTGSKLKGLDKLAQVPEQERRSAEQQILATTKKSMKEFYVRNLEAQVKQAVDAGVPQDSDYVRDYSDVISKIKAL